MVCRPRNLVNGRSPQNYSRKTAAELKRKFDLLIDDAKASKLELMDLGAYLLERSRRSPFVNTVVSVRLLRFLRARERFVPRLGRWNVLQETLRRTASCQLSLFLSSCVFSQGHRPCAIDRHDRGRTLKEIARGSKFLPLSLGTNTNSHAESPPLVD